MILENLSKLAHCIACTMSRNAQDVADVCVMHVLRRQDLPQSIVTDRGATFLNDWILLS